MHAMEACPRPEYLQVGEGGQLTIPAAMLAALGLSEGSVLLAMLDEAGAIVLEPVPSDPRERITAAFAPAGAQGTSRLAELRAEWDR